MSKKGTMDEQLRLDNQICYPLYACAKEIVRQYRKPLQELNLTYTQYIVMMVLWEFGGLTEGEIGEKVRLDSGTLTPLLKRLEKQGLVKRIRPKSNERKLFVQLTPEGEELKQKASAIPDAMKECIQMSDADLLLLRDLLKKAIHRMETGGLDEPEGDMGCGQLRSADAETGDAE